MEFNEDNIHIYLMDIDRDFIKGGIYWNEKPKGSESYLIGTFVTVSRSKSTATDVMLQIELSEAGLQDLLNMLDERVNNAFGKYTGETTVHHVDYSNTWSRNQ